MKAIILAAGQGTRLRPLTEDRPKCMVKVNGKSIIERQLETMRACGIKDGDITIVAGYRSDALKEKLRGSDMRILVNGEYETTNMVYSLMCARDVLTREDDILISYGDILYSADVLGKILSSDAESSVVVDDGWLEYWSARCENPLDDAETLMLGGDGHLTEIGQKTDNINRVQSQYIGLMRFRGGGLNSLLAVSAEAERRSAQGRMLWRTDRPYRKMYMTDLLQGMIDEGIKLAAVHIWRGWFEVDNMDDLRVAEAQMGD